MNSSSELDRPFKDKTPYLLYNVIIGLLFWIIDSLLDSTYYYEDYSFLEMFILDIPPHEIWVRGAFIAIVTFFILLLKFDRKQKIGNQLYSNFLELSLARISKLSTISTPQELFNPIVKEIHETMKISFVKILRLVDEDENLLLVGGIGWKDGLVGYAKVKSKLNSQAGFTLINDAPVIVEDLTREKRFTGPDLLLEHNIVSGVSIVIKVEGIQYGIIAVHSDKERKYTDVEISYLQSMGNLIAIAINKYNLKQEINFERAKYQDLYENSPVFMISVDATTLKIVECNKATLVNLGYSMEELMDFTIFDLYHPSCHERSRNIIVPFFREHGYIENEELVVVKKNGELMDVILNAVAIKSEDGTVLISRSTLQDITESKQIKNKIEENAKSLKRLNIIALTLYEATDAILRIADPDILFAQIAKIIVKNGYALSWIVWEDQYTKKVHSATHSNIVDIGFINIPDNWEYKHQENCPIGQCRDLGKIIIRSDVVDDEHISDWRKLMEIREFLSSIYLPIIFDKKVIGVVSVYSDTIAEFSQEEIKLLQRLTDTLSYALKSLMMGQERESLITEIDRGETELFKLLASIEQIDSLLMILDMDRNIEYANPAFKTITQYEPLEISGNLDIIFGDDQNSEAREMMQKATSEGNSFNAILKCKKKNGEYYCGDTLITPFRDKTGDISNVIVIQKDVTIQQLMQKELNQAQKMDGIGRISSGIAHDFKNLMGVISLSSDYINMLTENEEIKKEVKEIHETISTGTSIIQKLLTFSKTTSETLVLFDPQEVITNFSMILRRLITTRIGLEIDLCDKEYEIKGLPNSFEQVILNLVLNSRDAMPNGGTIRIITDILEKIEDQFIIDEDSHLINNIEEVFAVKKVEPGNYLLLQVNDNGTGIPKEIHEKIFEPFFTTKFEGDGTGLGLSTVYGIIKDFKGYIALNSVMNEGTTFHILIPVFLK